jgi:hypothetical protein
MTETKEPFFTREGAHFRVNKASRGPWNPNSLHGRVVIGLLGAEIERQFGGPGYIPARLTVDMYRLPDFQPVTVVTRLVREGGRIKVVDAEFISGGVSQARATCQLLKLTEKPEGQIWQPAPWNAAPPEQTTEENWRNAMWATRTISGGAMFGEGPRTEPRRAWISEVRDLIEGEPLTPFQRVAVMSDISSPFAHGSSNGLNYINTDVTLYLHRLPKTEWIGVDAMDHQASDGVATGVVRLYDVEGPIGTASTTALAQRRQAQPPRPAQAEAAG